MSAAEYLFQNREKWQYSDTNVMSKTFVVGSYLVRTLLSCGTLLCW